VVQLNTSTVWIGGYVQGRRGGLMWSAEPPTQEPYVVLLKLAARADPAGDESASFYRAINLGAGPL
jgi:hypothetical protein